MLCRFLSKFNKNGMKQMNEQFSYIYIHTYMLTLYTIVLSNVKQKAQAAAAAATTRIAYQKKQNKKKKKQSQQQSEKSKKIMNSSERSE